MPRLFCAKSVWTNLATGSCKNVVRKKGEESRQQCSNEGVWVFFSVKSLNMKYIETWKVNIMQD